MQSILRDRFKALYVTGLVVAGMAVFLPRQAQAQEHYISNANPEPSGDSARTGTQGVNGNPFCVSPVVTINGAPTTVRNWSCYNGPDPRVSTVRQPPRVSGVPNPCQPGGPGGYNYLNNAVGTRLPEGCIRPADNGGGRRIYAKSDPNYQPRSMSTDRVPPMRIRPVDVPQNYRRPQLPVGQLATGEVDPYYEPRPMSNYRRPPMPVGQLSSGEADPYYEPRPMSNYRRPPMPVGKLAPDYGSYWRGAGKPSPSAGRSSSIYGTPFEGYRKPTLPMGRISPDPLRD